MTPELDRESYVVEAPGVAYPFATLEEATTRAEQYVGDNGRPVRVVHREVVYERVPGGWPKHKRD